MDRSEELHDGRQRPPVPALDPQHHNIRDGNGAGGVVTSLLLALLVNRAIRGIYFFRAMFYMPVVSSFVSVSLIFLWIYEPNLGLANELLTTIGLPASKWLRGADTAMFAIILMSIWKNMGLNMVIYLAGLQGIPRTSTKPPISTGRGGCRRWPGSPSRCWPPQPTL